MEVRRFVCNPVKKALNIGIFKQGLPRPFYPGQLRIREMDMDRPMANRVKRDGYSAALGLGNGMMPLQPGPDGPAA
ncbi:hypothetical protein [Altericroceibacterium spongiae]|uniref:hypothetical protein n=1 Tax=Altericroceibacterium spongiae TaxID=2320269 RepID=UPI001604763A